MPVVEAAGWQAYIVQELGNPYISVARAAMLRKALDARADVIVFIDYDLSWRPGDLLKLIETEGDAVAGTYRFKYDTEEYMGTLRTGEGGKPLGRADGVLLADFVPAGFLKVTPHAINHLIDHFPELLYGDRYAPHFDLFQHGAHKWIWYGEDYAFSRRWRESGGQLWLVPDLALTHWAGETPYPGNFHEWLMRQPGGCHAA